MNKDAARRDRYDTLLRVSKANAEPEIIIWGPGPHRARDYQKRKQVKKAIQDEIPHGSVIFPEDAEVMDVSTEVLGSEDLIANELLQAGAADLVIALDISPAVGEEVARFSSYRKLAGKLLVVAPEERKSGYQGAIRDEVEVKFVKAEEMVSCKKTTRLCVGYVRRWCLDKYMKE